METKISQQELDGFRNRWIEQHLGASKAAVEAAQRAFDEVSVDGTAADALKRLVDAKRELERAQRKLASDAEEATSEFDDALLRFDRVFQ